MRRILVWLSIVMLARFCQAADDARLGKPVTLAVKGEALADILPLIEEQTGVRLKVAHDIADQKATVFVDDKPLKEVMAGLTTVFGFTWSYSDFKGERSYSLSMPIRLRRQREDWHKTAVEKAWPDFEKEIKRLAEMPVKSLEDLVELSKQTKPIDETSVFAPAFKVGGYDWDRRKRAAARLYLTLSPELKRSLREGFAVCYDLDGTEPEWRIPDKLQDEFRENLTVHKGMDVGPDEEAGQIDRYDTLGVEMAMQPSSDKFSVKVYERHGRCETNAGGYVFRIFEKLLGRIAPFPKVILPKKAVPDDVISYTEKELEEEAAVPKSEPWREEIYINRSDLLALFHKKLGLQIISDHYSHWYFWQPADKCSVTSILESLERFPGYRHKLKDLEKESRLAQLTDWHPAADWGWDGKLLYMRAANPMKMDSREIPNSKLRKWQAASKDRSLGLSEQADMSALPRDQLDMLQSNYDRLGIDVWNGNIGLDPGMRFYGLLSPSQRQLMLEGRLGTQALNAEQRSSLITLVPREKNPESRKGCRVGIYDKDGHRVDKPDMTSPEAYPEFVRLAPKSRKELYAAQHGEWSLTLEDALKNIGEQERLLLRKVICNEYEMTLVFPDGSETTRQTGIYTSTTWRLPSESPKPPD